MLKKDMLIERKTSGLTGLEVVTALYAQGQDRIAILNQRDSDILLRKECKLQKGDR